MRAPVGARRALASGRLGAVDAAVGEGVRLRSGEGGPTRLECSGEHGTDFGTAGQWRAAAEEVTRGITAPG